MLLLLFFEIIIITVKINFNKHTQKDRDRQRTRGHIYIFSLLNKAVYGFCLESVSSCQPFDFEMTCFETHSIASRTSLLYVHRLRWNSLHTPVEFVWDRTWMVLEVIKMQTATNACEKSDRSAIDFALLLTIDNNYNKYIHLSFIDAHVHLVDCHYFPTIYIFKVASESHLFMCNCSSLNGQCACDGGFLHAAGVCCWSCYALDPRRCQVNHRKIDSVPR